MMIYDPPLIPAILLQRYKRFLADVELENGDVITVHCPNPGAMLGLNSPGNPCWLHDSQNPKRKLLYTLELMEVKAPTGKVLVGINTNRPNKLAEAAILEGKIPQLKGYTSLRREVPYGKNSRIDLLLESDNKPPCYVEIKNVHFVRQPGLHEFPDCKTDRGTKHLIELEAMVQQGARAVMLYVIQREDGNKFACAADLDPKYAQTFGEVRKSGVEALAIRCQITLEGIVASTMIDVLDSN